MIAYSQGQYIKSRGISRDTFNPGVGTVHEIMGQSLESG